MIVNNITYKCYTNFSKNMFKCWTEQSEEVTGF